MNETVTGVIYRCIAAAISVGTNVQAPATYSTTQISFGSVACTACQSPKSSTTRLPHSAIVSSSMPNNGQCACLPSLDTSVSLKNTYTVKNNPPRKAIKEPRQPPSLELNTSKHTPATENRPANQVLFRMGWRKKNQAKTAASKPFSAG